MRDTLLLTFADGTTHRIECEEDAGNATIHAIIAREGEFASGWITDAAGKRLNLQTVVSIKITPETDPLVSYGQ